MADEDVQLETHAAAAQDKQTERAKRERKLTQKAAHAALVKQKNARKASMAQLTNKRNLIEPLLKSYDKEDDVRRQLSLFEKTMTAFAALHQTVQVALPVEERESDHKYWYLPRYNDYKKFKNKIHAWLENAPAKESCKSRNEHDNMSTTSKSSSKSTGSSIRRQAKAKKAESLARAATLENKLQLEREELELKAKKERLAIDMDIAVSEAQIRAMDLMDNNELQQLIIATSSYNC